MVKSQENNVCRILIILALSAVFCIVGCGGQVSTSESFQIAPYIQQLKPTEVTLKWQTDPNTAANIRYKKNSDWMWTNKSVASGDILHEVQLENLQPGTEYKYYVNTNGKSPLFSQPESITFTTPMLKPKKVTFAVYGDSRTHPDDHEKVLSAMIDKFAPELDFCLHTGDIVTDGRELELWPVEFFAPAGELISQIPMYPVLGNHEHDSPHYFDFFTLPGNERWYSFDLGDVHVTCLDSYSDLKPGSAQYQWLINDLAGSAARWKVAAFHAPIYSSGPHGKLDSNGVPLEKAISDLRRHILPIFEENNVTIAFNGHDHLYERSRKGNLYLITAGGGGAPLHQVKENKEQNPYSNIVISKHSYCIVRADADGFVMTAYDTKNEVIDEVKIKASGN